MTDASIQCVCGDARDPAAYAEALRGRRADLLLTDPPYCLLTRRRRDGDLREKRARKIDRDPVLRFETVRDYRRFCEEWLDAALAHLSPIAPLIIWTNFLGKKPLLETMEKRGYPHLLGEFVWAKWTTQREGNEQALRVYEVALVLARQAPKPPTNADPAQPWSAVTGYDDEGEGASWGQHPHHKPFSALEPLLRTYSAEGNLVLDPFAGSGSIPAAALRLGRAVACLELVPEWAARVGERLGSPSAR